MSGTRSCFTVATKNHNTFAVLLRLLWNMAYVMRWRLAVGSQILVWTHLQKYQLGVWAMCQTDIVSKINITITVPLEISFSWPQPSSSCSTVAIACMTLFSNIFKYRCFLFGVKWFRVRRTFSEKLDHTLRAAKIRDTEVLNANITKKSTFDASGTLPELYITRDNVILDMNCASELSKLGNGLWWSCAWVLNISMASGHHSISWCYKIKHVWLLKVLAKIYGLLIAEVPYPVRFVCFLTKLNNSRKGREEQNEGTSANLSWCFPPSVLHNVKNLAMDSEIDSVTMHW